MFLVDALLTERAEIALLPMTGDAPCDVSPPLARPYQALRLAVFRGEEGRRLADQARAGLRFSHEDRDYRVIADLSKQLTREDTLLVEPA